MKNPTRAIVGRWALVTAWTVATAGILPAPSLAQSFQPEYVTVHPVISDARRREFFIDSGQAWPLPLPGVAENQVTIYHGMGRRWYWDNFHMPVMIDNSLSSTPFGSVAPGWALPSWPYQVGAPIYFPATGIPYYVWHGRHFPCDLHHPFWGHMNDWHNPNFWHFDKHWLNTRQGEIKLSETERAGFKHYFGGEDHMPPGSPPSGQVPSHAAEHHAAAPAHHEEHHEAAPAHHEEHHAAPAHHEEHHAAAPAHHEEHHAAPAHHEEHHAAPPAHHEEHHAAPAHHEEHHAAPAHHQEHHAAPAHHESGGHHK